MSSRHKPGIPTRNKASSELYIQVKFSCLKRKLSLQGLSCSSVVQCLPIMYTVQYPAQEKKSVQFWFLLPTKLFFLATKLYIFLILPRLS